MSLKNSNLRVLQIAGGIIKYIRLQYRKKKKKENIKVGI